MNRIDAQCSAENYIVGENEIAVCSGLIDPSQPNWRETLCSELLDDEVEVLSIPDDTSTAEDDGFDKDISRARMPPRASVSGPKPSGGN